MKIGTVASAAVVAFVACVGVWWMTRSGPSAESPAAVAGDSARDDEPKPSKTGPHPKVVLAEGEYSFGTMKMGDTGSHTFVIRNEGEAPLRLGNPQTTCQCTVSEAAKNAIPPGGEGEVTLSWTPTAPTDSFNKGATLATNDPNMPEITLAVVGRVDSLVNLEPLDVWNAGDVVGNVPVTVSGVIYSRLLDEFEVTEVDGPSELFSAKVEPMDAAALDEYDAKSGHNIVVTLAEGLPVGRFSEPFKIKTDVDDKASQEMDVKISGTRRGPIQVLPTPGTNWRPDAFLVDLGRFSAADGSRASVTLFVADLPEGEHLQFEKVDSSTPDVQLELKHDEAFTATNRQKYELTFVVLPGATPAVHRGAGTATVEASTNHPDAKSMKFRVQYIATQ